MSFATSKSISVGVLIWDQDRERATRIIALLDRQGVSCTAINSAHDVKGLKHTACIVLVALGRSAQDQPQALTLIAEVRRYDHTVLAFGDDTPSWPLSTRCRVLLAGAESIHDSASSDSLIAFCQRIRILRESTEKVLHEESSKKELFRELGIVGVSTAISSLERLVFRVSKLSDLPVLIEGESGTGKELFARAIHALDPRRRASPFVAVNCAALPKDLAEAELFGHRRGAFTGADIERKGLFRAAEGGVVFLDEIGELKLDLQAKLLRVLQENRVLPLGEDRETPIDVRILAATNRDLRGRVDEGMFREDLFHRLNVIPLRIPALRERPEDIGVLVEYFFSKYRHLSSPDLEITQEFIEALLRSRLSGNAREVENIVRKALVSKEQETKLGLNDLPPHLWHELSESSSEEKSPTSVTSHAASFEVPALFESVLQENGWNLARSMKRCELSLLETAMRRTGGNQSEAARILGVTPRSIYNKLHQRPENR
jgi:transcriptional regulator with GAF, ATPase, and Fis domain